VAPNDAWGLGSVREHWDGARWRLLPNQFAGMATSLNGARAALLAGAAISADDLWAVGWQDDAAGTPRPLISHYAGGLCFPGDPLLRRTTVADQAYAALDDAEGGRVFVASQAPSPAESSNPGPGVPGLGIFDANTGALLRITPLNRTDTVLTTPQGSNQFSTYTRVAGRLALDRRTNHLFVLDGDASLGMHDATSGALLHTIAVGVYPSTVAVDERAGRAFVVSVPSTSSATATGSVSTINSRTGAVLATTPLPIAPGADSQYWPVGVPLAVAPRVGRVFVATGQNASGVPGGLAMLNAATGKLLHILPVAAAAPTGALAVLDTGDRAVERLIVATATNTVVVLDATNGTLLRTLAVHTQAAFGVPAVLADPAHRQVIVDGSTIVDGASGAVMGRLPIMLAGVMDVDWASRRAVLASPLVYNHYGEPIGFGAAQVVNLASGQALAQATVDAHVEAAAFDPRTGHAFVVAGNQVTALNGNPRSAVVPPPQYPTAPAKPPCGTATPGACPGARYFVLTQHTLAGPFLAYWQQRGGRGTLGSPLSEPFVEEAQVRQFTERFLLDLDHGLVRPVPLGRLLTAGRHFARVVPVADTPDRRYFAATGHTLSGRFLAYWQAHGGTAVLGLPIAQPTYERNGDSTGRRYLVQWCGNARLEYHPEAAGTPYEVQLGLLGRQVLVQRGWLRA
jgi:DNA-binding beta-propeller fold protein YncE